MKPTALILGLGLLLSSGPGAIAAQPLLMDGKSRLYQRVLMRATVPRQTEPAGPALQGAPASAVEPYYVYARRAAAGAGWLQLGAGSEAENLFWVPEADTVPWRQNIVLTFTNHGDPGRALIVENLDALYQVIESEDPGRAAGALRQGAEAREQALRRSAPAPAANGVVALGPAQGIDEREHFYVMPILSAEEALMETGGYVNLLEVAVAKSARFAAAAAPPPDDAPPRTPSKWAWCL